MKTCLILVASLSAALASCSKGSDSDSKAAASSEKAAASPEGKAEATSTEDDGNPCDLFTEAILRKHLELAGDVEINQELSNAGGFPHCAYKWNMPEQENRSPGYGSAHLTITKEMDSEEAAVGSLESVRTMLEKRAKANADKENVDFTSPFSDVEGVGAKAHYSTQQRQLSFAYSKRLFHLGIRPHGEGDAKALAQAIASEIAK